MTHAASGRPTRRPRRAGEILERLRSHVATATRRLGVAGTSDDDVHEARKAMKRARAMLALLGEALDPTTSARVERGLKVAAKHLAEARDALVVDQAFDRVLEASDLQRGDFPGVSRALQADRRRTREPRSACMRRTLASQRALQKVQRDLQGAVREDGARRTLKRNLRSIYRRGRQRMPAPGDSPSTRALHAWRRHVKRLQYALGPYAPGGTSAARRMARRASRVGEWLGTDHDLALLERRVARMQAPARIGRLRQAVADERRRLQRRALATGRELYARRPKAAVRALGVL